MKLLKLFLLSHLIILFYSTQAQVQTDFNNKNLLTNKGKFTKEYKTKFDFEVPAKNITILLEEEKREQLISDDVKPFKLAVAVPVDIDIVKKAEWILDSNYSFAKFTIKLNGALSASINLDQFNLPKGTEMFIYNENGNMITGPITENENNQNKMWGSWVLHGQLLTLEIKTPTLTKDQLILHSNNIAYGYKEVYKTKVGGFGVSEPCNINILCPLGNGWEAERNSVGVILNGNGTTFCSGSLLMNTCNTNKPFFLTANHCYESNTNIAAWRFTFQAWSSTCTPNQNSNGVTYYGSSLKANWSTSDFCLLELNYAPPANSGINYAGWSRSPTPAQNATGIHHPRGDVMKISRANNPVTRTGYYSTGTDHWQANWSQQNNGAGQTVTAITEPGSSGSPLFDQNHRIVGQLHGGPSGCTKPNKWDYYGSFDVSWNGGGTNTTRLSNWLDPGSYGVVTTNTTNVANLTPGYYQILGNDYFCTTSDYSVNDLPPGASVTWIESPAGIVSLRANGNSVTVTKNTDAIFTLTATITGIQCTSTTSRTLKAGSVWPDMNIYGPTSVSCGQVVTYSTSHIEGAGYQWSYPSSWIYNYGQGTWSITFQIPDYSSESTSGEIRLLTYDACNATMLSTLYVSSSCGGSLSTFSMSPNPATSTVTISPKETILKENRKRKAITEINIYDQQGNLNKRHKFGKVHNATINISDLRIGIYVIEIVGDNYKERQMLSVVR